MLIDSDKANRIVHMNTFDVKFVHVNYPTVYTSEYYGTVTLDIRGLRPITIMCVLRSMISDYFAFLYMS